MGDGRWVNDGSNDSKGQITIHIDFSTLTDRQNHLYQLWSDNKKLANSKIFDIIFVLNREELFDFLFF